MSRKIFYDTEFLEGTQSKTFLGIKYGDTCPTIDLISIGMVDENGLEFNAISKEFNLKEAWNRFDLKVGSGDQRNHWPNGIKVYWIRENVLKPIFDQLCDFEFMNTWEYPKFSLKSMRRLLNIYGSTRKEIRHGICNYFCSYHTASEWAGVGSIDEGFKDYMRLNPIELYGYYSAYDHVVFAWIFGKMINLPEGVPMYTIDLKQKLDSMLMWQEHKYEGETRLESWLKTAKSDSRYPKQSNEHSCIHDARWNFELYKFLNNYSGKEPIQDLSSKSN